MIKKCGSANSAAVSSFFLVPNTVCHELTVGLSENISPASASPTAFVRVGILYHLRPEILIDSMNRL